jgi:hypothetical protein
VDKCIQLYETILVRHTTMVVGPTGGGKTVVFNTLQKAMAPAFGNQVKTFVINPKAQTVSELYGVMDPLTRDWTDGMLSKIFRTINQPLPPGECCACLVCVCVCVLQRALCVNPRLFSCGLLLHQAVRMSCGGSSTTVTSTRCGWRT